MRSQQQSRLQLQVLVTKWVQMGKSMVMTWGWKKKDKGFDEEGKNASQGNVPPQWLPDEKSEQVCQLACSNQGSYTDLSACFQPAHYEPRTLLGWSHPATRVHWGVTYLQLVWWTGSLLVAWLKTGSRERSLESKGWRSRPRPQRSCKKQTRRLISLENEQFRR